MVKNENWGMDEVTEPAPKEEASEEFTSEKDVVTDGDDSEEAFKEEISEYETYDDEENGKESWGTEREVEVAMTDEASETEEELMEEQFASDIAIEETDAQDKRFATAYVDPSKNPKQKRIKEQKQEVKKVKKKNLGIIVVSCIVFLLALFLLFQIASKSSKQNFFSILDGILQTKLGSYTYVFDIRTSEHSDKTEQIIVANIEELEGVESVDLNEDVVVEGSRNSFVEWTNADGIKMTSWRYPKYKITVDGATTSLEPYTATATISIATEYFNDVFTDITAFEGNYYVNIESIGKWLRNSKDTYLVGLGNRLPEGSRYLVIPFEELYIPSRYAEDAELDLSKVPSIETLISRVLLFESCVEGNFKDCISKEALTSGVSTFDVIISGDDSVAVQRELRGMLSQAGNYYRSYVSTAVEKGLYNEEQSKQAMREEDNIIRALTDLMVYMNLSDLSPNNFQLTGTARKYENSKGIDSLEAKVVSKIKTDSKDYDISISLMRTGEKVDIRKPDGSTLIRDSLPEPTLIGNTFNRVVDYFNPTMIDFELKQELNPQRIKESVKMDLVQLVNNLPEAETYLTILTVDDYIAKYMAYEVTDESSAVDRINKQIVTDFANTLNSITGKPTLAEEEEVSIEEVLELYPEIAYEDSNVKMTGKINEEETDSTLACIDLLIMNKAEGDLELDLTTFSLRTLLSSVYPANNLTLLHAYDNSWDGMMSPESMVIPTSGYKNLKLYFVTSNDTGYMDLWVGEKKLGVAVSY